MPLAAVYAAAATTFAAIGVWLRWWRPRNRADLEPGSAQTAAGYVTLVASALAAAAAHVPALRAAAPALDAVGATALLLGAALIAFGLRRRAPAPARGFDAPRVEPGPHTLPDAAFDSPGPGVDRASSCTLRDGFDLDSAEEHLRHSQKMQAVGQLTSGLAHDFNNLLTIMIGNLQLLDLELDHGESLRSHVHAAFRAAMRGADLTKRLLAFSRRQALLPRTTDPNRLIGELAPLLSRTLGENIALKIELTDQIGTIEVDPGELENALVNLALNSRDAMPNGGDLVIRTSRDGERIALTVADSGEGIAEDLLPRVFEPFFSTKEPNKGTGLGLSMVYGFVTQSKGRIAIDSKVGRGTTVRIVLPRSAAPEEASRAAQTMSQRALPSGEETILVVEDNADARRVASTTLAGLGYRILEASDATDALAVLTEHADAVDLLLTDIVLPGGVNGPQLGRRALEQRPNLKVLYVSGCADTSAAATAERGAPLLSKPYLSKELAQAVRTALDCAEPVTSAQRSAR